MHAVDRAQQRRLATTRRTDERSHMTTRERKVDVLERMELPVEEVEVLELDLRGELGHFLSRYLVGRFLAEEHAGDDVEDEYANRDDEHAGPRELLPLGEGT